MKKKPPTGADEEMTMKFVCELDGEHITRGRNAAAKILNEMLDDMEDDTEYTAFIVGFLATCITAVHVGVIPEVVKAVIEEANILSDEMRVEQQRKKAANRSADG